MMIAHVNSLLQLLRIALIDLILFVNKTPIQQQQIVKQMSSDRSGARSQQYQQIFQKNQVLEQQLLIKSQKIDDLNFELKNLKKEQSIWEQLGKSDSKKETEREHELLRAENKNLMNQITNLLIQNQHKERLIEQLKQKISDMKYHNEQLKRISKKSEQIYTREIQMLKISCNDKSKDETSLLKQEKQKLSAKMNKCAQIVKETEEYYLNCIKIMDKQQQEQILVIKTMEEELMNSAFVIKQLQQEIESLKQEMEQNKENTGNGKDIKNKWDGNENVGQLITRQNIKKRWQLALSQMKDRYEREIDQLKGNIKFLIHKLESVQDSNFQQNKRNSYDNNSNIFGSSSSSLLAQSKIMINSTQSNESFRFTPNNSFSSSIKESLSRRESGTSAKTPKKQVSRYSNNPSGFLLDHTNI